MKGQTRRHSLTESVANVIVGYWLAVASQVILFPFFGVYVTLADNFLIAGWFTVISIIRSYCLRRAFNGVTLRVADALNRVGMGIDLGYGDIQKRRLTGIQKELPGIIT